MRIRDPRPPGPYALTKAGCSCKYEEGRRKMVQAYDDMRESGETVIVPMMALSLTEEGDAAARTPMEMGDPSDDAVEKEDAAGRPEGDQEETEERGVAKAAYISFYRRMRIFGFKRAKVAYEWPRERRTDYNLGWASVYAERRAGFCGIPKAAQTSSTFTWARRGYMKERAPGTHGRWKAGRLCRRRGATGDGKSLEA